MARAGWRQFFARLGFIQVGRLRYVVRENRDRVALLTSLSPFAKLIIATRGSRTWFGKDSAVAEEFAQGADGLPAAIGEGYSPKGR